MHLPSVAFCVDTQSEAEGILNDITKQKRPSLFGRALADQKSAAATAVHAQQTHNIQEDVDEV